MSVRNILMAAGGSADDKLYVDDVFSAYTYTGNGSAQTINNGIDLAGKGGLVWTKIRNFDGTISFPFHYLSDSARGADQLLSTNRTDPQRFLTESTFVHLNNGFRVKDVPGWGTNSSSFGYVSWTFRKAPKFFDVVTWTGNGASNRAIAHSLGVAPGMIIVKSLNNAGTWFDWTIWHRTFPTTGDYLILNSTAAKTSANMFASNAAQTASVFTLGSDGVINQTGNTYVAYLFAHDPSADGIIQCGSYTGNGSATGPIVNLGWEPQYLMIKNASGMGNWQIIDSMRGMPVGSADATLQANLANAESSVDYISPTATGFQLASTSSEVNTSDSTYIYLAIRRPNKPPTTGTQVYNAIARTGTGAGAAATVTGVGFAPDALFSQNRNQASSSYNSWYDRLRGVSSRLSTNSTNAEYPINETSTALLSFDMNGYSLGSDWFVHINGNDTTYINHFFKRAPGFFDVVCYTGTGVARTVPHSLGVVPGLLILKARNMSGEAWIVGYASSPDAATILALNSTNGNMSGNPTIFNSTRPTSSVLSLGTATSVNANAVTYVAYLFATLPGISKVGSYVGNGTSQTINCGFTTGARFILIKRTDSTGEWYIWDTARGIVAGNDLHLSLNTTAAEVTTNDSIDPNASGFIVNQVAATNINVSGGTYIFLAIA